MLRRLGPKLGIIIKRTIRSTRKRSFSPMSPYAAMRTEQIISQLNSDLPSAANGISFRTINKNCLLHGFVHSSTGRASLKECDTMSVRPFPVPIYNMKLNVLQDVDRAMQLWSTYYCVH